MHVCSSQNQLFTAIMVLDTMNLQTRSEKQSKKQEQQNGVYKKTNLLFIQSGKTEAIFGIIGQSLRFMQFVANMIFIANSL